MIEILWFLSGALAMAVGIWAARVVTGGPRSLPPATSRQIERAQRANRAELRVVKAGPWPPRRTTRDYGDPDFDEEETR